MYQWATLDGLAPHATDASGKLTNFWLALAEASQATVQMINFYQIGCEAASVVRVAGVFCSAALTGSAFVFSRLEELGLQIYDPRLASPSMNDLTKETLTDTAGLLPDAAGLLDKVPGWLRSLYEVTGNIYSLLQWLRDNTNLGSGGSTAPPGCQ